ncbi:DNA mismatch repair protein MutS [Saprospiraceae bacterium]|nr:DNA mismatch repair protein MutS [Saprospiraceae bacterium]
MAQYLEIKQKHPDALLLFRVGDFYETFGEDAIKCSEILGIVLTARNNGGSKIELAGFPYHSVDLYLPKLVKAGYRVAICEQMEKPSKEKKIVRRDVTEVVTPGVTISDSILDATQNNFLASVYYDGKKAGIAFLDISTGEFISHQGRISEIENLIQSFAPNEILFSKSQKEIIDQRINDNIYTFGLDEWFYELAYNQELLHEHFKVLSMKGFGLHDLELAQIAAGTILHYLSTIQQKRVSHIHHLSRMESDRYLWLDRFTIRNLELIYPLHETGVSLYQIINKTTTPMGARMLSKWIVLPLKHVEDINDRLKKVDFFYSNENARLEIVTLLKSIGDLERLSSKIPMGRINPREFIVIQNTLETIGKLKTIMAQSDASSMQELSKTIDTCQGLHDIISSTLREDAPVSLSKGYIIKDGYEEALDEWKSIAKNSKDILLDMQADQAEKTGISSLKIGYNNVFGYYFEVTNRYKDQGLIPDNWVRKQTLKAAERYINEDLKTLETKILKAEVEINDIEQRLFLDLIEKSEKYVSILLSNAKIIGEVDCYCSLATIAEQRQYVKPLIDEGYIIDVKSGRHPVIEAQLPAEKPYVPNDVYLDSDSQQIIIITGPNMSGKSAVLRQTALITLLAHIGSFVPAQSATIGLVDKIFTRVGATDNISSGESTFMVEMNETASILNNLSARSLIILDEIGRGTSTYDGISIAWAIAEYLHNENNGKPKTLFATHYHELSELEESFERIHNFNISTKEIDDKIIFLRKLIPGACNASFGIHVAQLAGMPKELLTRSNELLKALEEKTVGNKDDVKSVIQNKSKQSQSIQLSIFDQDSRMMKELRSIIDDIDLETMTPIECMLKLKELTDRIKEE